MALQPNLRRTTISRSAANVDEGLRQYMLGIYTYMGFGVLLTGLVSYFIGTNERLLLSLFSSQGMMYLLMFLPVGIALWLNLGINRIKASTAQLLFWVYAALIGVALAPIFVLYTDTSIAKAFFIAAAMFGGMSLYGYTTQKDLSGIGSFLIMGVWGLLVAMIVNIFLRSSGLDFLISIVAVLVFTGLTAYETQLAKASYQEDEAGEITKKKSIIFALQLYINFINMFIHLLRLMNSNRN